MLKGKLRRAAGVFRNGRNGVATLEYGITAAIVTAYLLPSFSAYTNALDHMMQHTSSVLIAQFEQAQRTLGGY